MSRCVAALHSGAEAERRLRELGPNLVPEIAHEPPWLRLLKEFVHFFSLILWVAAGLTKDLVYLWEREYRRPRRRSLERVARVLGVTPRYLELGLRPAPGRDRRGSGPGLRPGRPRGRPGSVGEVVPGHAEQGREVGVSPAEPFI